MDDSKEEEQLEEQLEYLKGLHLKLRHLRTTLPRMLESLSSKHGSPQEAYESFLQSVDTANREVQDFKRSWTCEETRTLLNQVTESRKANPRGVLPWRARDDPSWTTPKRKHTEVEHKT